jgi:hypothetical protein
LKKKSETMQDPTGEYQRHRRNLRFSRVGMVIGGVIRVVLGLFGVLSDLIVLGYLFWTHSTAWLPYLLMVCLLVPCALMAYVGWQQIQTGRRPVTSLEVQQAKQKHRQTLQEAVRGKLPDTYSKGSRYLFLGGAIFFGLLAGVSWYFYLADHAGDMLSYAIGYSSVTVFALLGFLVSFGGKAHQRESAAEFRRILQAGEFSAPENSDKSEK